MTKKELFEVLKRCIILVGLEHESYLSPKVNYLYEVDGNYFHWLMTNLENEVNEEEANRFNTLYSEVYVAAIIKAVTFFSDSPNFQVMFNNNVTIFKYGDFKTVVKCDKEDKFVPLIGLGIALYRYYRKQKSTKNQIYYLEHGLKLSHEKLAEYCVNYFCDFDKSKEKELINKLKNYKEGQWINI